MNQRTKQTIELDVYATIEAALRRVHPRLEKRAMTPNLSLIDDLGIDSIRFAELACILEEQLGLPPSALQRWVDDEALKAGKNYTIGALVRACEGNGHDEGADA